MKYLILLLLAVLCSSCGNDIPCGDAMTKAIESPDSIPDPEGGASITITIDTTWREHEVIVFLPN